MALVRGLAKPRHRRGLVARDAVATEMQAAKPGLGIGIGLLGQRLPQFEGDRVFAPIVGGLSVLQRSCSTGRADGASEFNRSNIRIAGHDPTGSLTARAGS